MIIWTNHCLLTAADDKKESMKKSQRRKKRCDTYCVVALSGSLGSETTLSTLTMDSLLSTVANHTISVLTPVSALAMSTHYTVLML